MDGRDLAATAATPVELAAGPFAATLEHGALGRILLGDVEVLSGVYAAVRDRSWGTIEPAFTRYDVERGDGTFAVRLSAACRRPADGVDVEWTGRVVGGPDGLHVTFDATVREPFLAARIGLCVLHPQRLAGARVAVETPWGRLRGRFPTLITAHLPFSNVRTIRQDLGRASEVKIAFEGDLFQVEDQRAFTDPSFKTFSTPLELPWPVLLQPGTRIHQVVHVRATAAAHPSAGRRRAAGSHARDAATIEIGAPGGRRPRIGTAVPPAGVRLDAPVLDALATLGLDYVRLAVTPDAPGQDLDRAASLARQLGVPLAVAIVAGAGVGDIGRIVAAVAAVGVRLDRVAVLDPLRHTTPPASLAELRAALAAAGLEVPAGGGSRAYVYQLALDGIAPGADFVEYPVNPQVHASDDGSILDTVASHPATVATARALAGGAAVHVAPASMRPHCNPDLVGPEPEPAPGGLPARYDARQPDLLTATWSLGALAELAGAGVASVCLHEAAGWGGLVGAGHDTLPPLPLPDGALLPVGHVVAAATAPHGARVCAVRAPARVSVLALQHPGGLRVLLASRERAVRGMAVQLPFAIGAVAALMLTADAPGGWRPIRVDPPGRRRLSIEVPARGVVCLDLS